MATARDCLGGKRRFDSRSLSPIPYQINTPIVCARGRDGKGIGMRHMWTI